MKNKIILFILASSFLCMNSVFADVEKCNELSISIHNTSLTDSLIVDYVLPADAGKSGSNITIAPGETYSLVTAINPDVGFLNIRPHDNVWVGIKVYNTNIARVFNGVIIKNVSRVIATSMSQFGASYNSSVDPAGKIYKASDSVFDDEHYTYTEEQNYIGNCVDSIPGQYTFAIGSKG